MTFFAHNPFNLRELKGNEQVNIRSNSRLWLIYLTLKWLTFVGLQDIKSSFAAVIPQVHRLFCSSVLKQNIELSSPTTQTMNKVHFLKQ